MRAVIISCLIALSLAACLNENRIEPAKPGSFVRYINGGYDDEPKALARASDGGYVILANTLDYPTTDPNASMDRVKLVKVDKYGTVEWTRILPENPGTDVVGFHANGIHVFDGGYIISGGVIKSNSENLLIIQTDADGLQKNTQGASIGHYEIALESTKDADAQIDGRVQGLAASWVSETELLVLGSVSEFPGKDMVVAEINISTGTPDVRWDWMYGSGSTTLINKLFIDNDFMVFAGTTTTDPGNANLKDMRFLRAQQDAATTIADLPYGDPVLSESANGMCRTLTGYAVVGSSTVTGKTDRDIMFTRFATNANGAVPLTDTTYAVYYQDTEPATENDVRLDDEGNAICETSDRGFIILGTIQSADTEDGFIGRGDTDYYLIRINTFGEVQWTKAFGSQRQDTGVDVLQAEDGGYMILGRTVLANVPTIALIKTDANGEIN
jgi:hypothetical protein